MARANRVREIWAEGKAVINSWLGVPSSFSAEVMAHAGWDSLVVDMQHGMIEYQTMVTMLQGISTTDTVPLVRVRQRLPLRGWWQRSSSSCNTRYDQRRP